MYQLDSQALQELNRILGSAGGSGLTEIDDRVVNLVLDILPVVRRSRTVSGSGGIFTARLANVHAAADAQTQTVDPYGLTGTAQAGFPRPVPDGFDVWLLGLTGTATVDALISTTVPAWCFLQYPSTATAIGTVGAVSRVVKAFNGQTTFSGGARILHDSVGGVNAAFGPPRPIRLPRGTLIGWNSTSLLAGTLQLNVVLGLFPAGLGQDGEN